MHRPGTRRGIANKFLLWIIVSDTYCISGHQPRRKLSVPNKLSAYNRGYELVFISLQWRQGSISTWFFCFVIIELRDLSVKAS